MNPAATLNPFGGLAEYGAGPAVPALSGIQSIVFSRGAPLLPFQELKAVPATFRFPARHQESRRWGKSGAPKCRRCGELMLPHPLSASLGAISP